MLLMKRQIDERREKTNSIKNKMKETKEKLRSLKASFNE
jgi:uncharacterized protein YqgV (UPF0045/DUF77 family)